MHTFRSSKKGTRKGRPVGFPRCKSRDRSKPSDTFTESTRQLAKKVTISHVGGRWQESVLEQYLIQDQIRPVFQSVACPPPPGQSGPEAKRLLEAREDRGAVAQMRRQVTASGSEVRCGCGLLGTPISPSWRN